MGYRLFRWPPHSDGMQMRGLEPCVHVFNDLDSSMSKVLMHAMIGQTMSEKLDIMRKLLHLPIEVEARQARQAKSLIFVEGNPFL